MRILLPPNCPYEDRDRVELPMAVIWHSNAIEVPDATPKELVAALVQALAAFDAKAPTKVELEAGEALKLRREAALTLREAVGKVDLDTAKGDEFAEPVRALLRYMLARMGSEGD